MIKVRKTPNCAILTNLQIFGLVFISMLLMLLNIFLQRILMQEQEITQFVGIRKLSEL